MNLFLKSCFVLSVAVCATQANADLLPNATVSENTPSLSARVMDKDIQGLTKSLFHDQNANLSQLGAFNPSSRQVDKPTTAKEGKNEQGLIDRLNAVASSTMKKFTQNGIASWYGRQFHGRPTASGERFDMNAMTAAHKSLPLNCYIRVTNRSNGKSVVVKVNDRGPFHGNRVLDLSYGAAKAIGLVDVGSGNVTIERVDGPTS